MVRPELVDYLRENLNQFPLAELRRRLANDGVSDIDFDESLKAALAPPAKAGKKPPMSGARKKIFLISGALLCIGAGLLVFQSSSPTPQDQPAAPGGTVTQAQSVFLGNYGYVIRLPPGYGYAREFADARKTVERVYFCKTGTSRMDFIDTGLYGQLGIVRMEAQPNPWAGQTDGPAQLSAMILTRLSGQEQQFSTKSIQVGALRGIQVDFQAPFTHVEAYLLGPKTMFSFYAGADDNVYQAILTGLRDESSEG